MAIAMFFAATMLRVAATLRHGGCRSPALASLPAAHAEVASCARPRPAARTRARGHACRCGWSRVVEAARHLRHGGRMVISRPHGRCLRRTRPPGRARGRTAAAA